MMDLRIEGGPDIWHFSVDEGLAGRATYTLSMQGSEWVLKADRLNHGLGVRRWKATVKSSPAEAVKLAITALEAFYGWG